MNDKIQASRLLIVGGDRSNLQLIDDALSSAYCHVGMARNEIDALKAIEANTPDLILLDVIPPGKNGFETYRQLKATELAAEIPMLFLMSNDSDRDIAAGFTLGTVDYISQPFIITELLSKVNIHLNLIIAQRKALEQQKKIEQMTQTLCHDLANPLAVLLAQTELAQLDSTILKEAPDQFLETLLLSITRCQKIIDSARTLG